MRSYRSIDFRARFFNNMSKPSIVIGSCILVVFVFVLLITLFVGWIAGGKPENAGVVRAWQSWSWGLGTSGLGLILLGVWVYIKKERWLFYSSRLRVGPNALNDIAHKLDFSPRRVLSDLATMNRLGMTSGVGIDRAAETITVQPGAICFGDYIDPGYEDRAKAEAAKKAREERLEKERQQEKAPRTLPCPGCSAPTTVPRGETVFCPYCNTAVLG